MVNTDADGNETAVPGQDTSTESGYSLPDWFKVNDFLTYSGSGWNRVNWLEMFRSVAVTIWITVAGGIIAFIQGFPRSSEKTTEAFRSFLGEVISLVFNVPRMLFLGSVDGAVAEITTHGVAGFTAATVLFAGTWLVVAWGVQQIAGN